MGVWEKARESGAYQFNSDILQVTVPAATLRNIGNGSHEDRFYLEGETDLRAQEMRMTLLSDSTGGGIERIGVVGAVGHQHHGRDGTRLRAA